MKPWEHQFRSKPSRFASLKRTIKTRSKPIEAPLRLPVRAIQALLVDEPHQFPEAFRAPALPQTIRDETLEFYGFVFCHGGFRRLEMTFEQFLLVAAAIKPADLPATREEAWTH